MAAFGAARTKDCFLQARYKRLIAHRGPIKALDRQLFARQLMEGSNFCGVAR
ncbi:hypothetical protein [Streptomyces tubercidicus]